MSLCRASCRSFTWASCSNSARWKCTRWGPLYACPGKQALHSLLHPTSEVRSSCQAAPWLPGAAQGSIKAARHAAPASAPAALAPPLQRYRPASLMIERGGSSGLDPEHACHSEAPQAYGDVLPGQELHAAGMGAGGEMCTGAFEARGDTPEHHLARAGGSRELLDSLGLTRTCSPSDFSFSELLSSAGGARLARGGSGARRCLRYDDDACPQRALYDSRGSAPRLLTAGAPTLHAMRSPVACTPQ